MNDSTTASMPQRLKFAWSLKLLLHHVLIGQSLVNNFATVTYAALSPRLSPYGSHRPEGRIHGFNTPIRRPRLLDCYAPIYFASCPIYSRHAPPQLILKAKISSQSWEPNRAWGRFDGRASSDFWRASHACGARRLLYASTEYLRLITM